MDVGYEWQNAVALYVYVISLKILLDHCNVGLN